MSRQPDTRSSFDEPAITVFMLVKTMPEWLAMSVDERFSELAKHVEPIVQRHRDRVRLRFYDVEFYTARVTDVWVWDALDHHASGRWVASAQVLQPVQ